MPNVNVNLAVASLKSITDTLRKYSDNALAYLNDPVSVIPEDLASLPDEIKPEDLLTVAVTTTDSSSGFDRGAITEALYTASAFQREIEMRGSTKYDYYLQAMEDLQKYSEKVTAVEGQFLNRIRGTNIE